MRDASAELPLNELYVFTVPPETCPISPTILNSGRLSERSAKALVRVRSWDKGIGPADCFDVGGTVRGATVARMEAVELYVSRPPPTARPKIRKLLLATSRHALVF